MVIFVVFVVSIIKSTNLDVNLWNLTVKLFVILIDIDYGWLSYNISFTLIVNGIITFINILARDNKSFTYNGVLNVNVAGNYNNDNCVMLHYEIVSIGHYNESYVVTLKFIPFGFWVYGFCIPFNLIINVLP